MTPGCPFTVWRLRFVCASCVRCLRHYDLCSRLESLLAGLAALAARINVSSIMVIAAYVVARFRNGACKKRIEEEISFAQFYSKEFRLGVPLNCDECQVSVERKTGLRYNA